MAGPARKEGSSWDYVLDQFYNNNKFEVVVRRLVEKANKQLHDSYRVQKMYQPGKPSSSVWTRTYAHYTRGKKEVIHNWFEESAWRKRNDHKSLNGSGKQPERWYSTGHSAEISKIEVENDDIQNGVFTATTTFGMLMAEMGLGKTGNEHVRGKGKRGLKGIKVDRSKNYVAKQRYVDDWKPIQGKTHRPTTRRQLNFLARAIKNFAANLYEYKLESWLIYDLAQTINGTPLVMSFDGQGVMTLEAKIPTDNGIKPVAEVPKPSK